MKSPLDDGEFFGKNRQRILKIIAGFKLDLTPTETEILHDCCDLLLCSKLFNDSFNNSLKVKIKAEDRFEKELKKYSEFQFNDPNAISINYEKVLDKKRELSNIRKFLNTSYFKGKGKKRNFIRNTAIALLVKFFIDKGNNKKSSYLYAYDIIYQVEGPILKIEQIERVYRNAKEVVKDAFTKRFFGTVNTNNSAL